MRTGLRNRGFNGCALLWACESACSRVAISIIRALSINKLEKPLTPPPSNHPLNKSFFPFAVTVRLPRVSRVFLVHGLSPPGPPELCVAVVWFDPCPVLLVATDEFEFATEMATGVVVSPASWDGPGDLFGCRGCCRPRVVCHRAAVSSPADCSFSGSLMARLSPDGAECDR